MISFLNKGSGGGSSKANIFIQNTEPETKEGIWFKKTAGTYDKLITADRLTGNIITNTWEAFSTSVLASRVHSYGKYLYILDKGIRYDTETNTEIPDYTTVQGGYGSAIIDDKIYFFNTTQNAGFDWVTTCNRYDITTNSWETYSESSGSLDINAIGSTAVAVGNKIYLISGNSGNTTSINTFDIITKEWAKANINLPYSTFYGTCASVGTKIYIFGGLEVANRNKRIVYDTISNTISTEADIPFNSTEDSAVSIGTNIYIIHSNSVYVFDTIKEMYENLGTIPITFSNPDSYKSKSTVIDNVIYLISPGNNLTKIIPPANINFEPNSVVLQNGSTYKTSLLTQPANVQGRVTTSFANAYMTDNSGNLITTDEKYYGNGTSWVEIV